MAYIREDNGVALPKPVYTATEPSIVGKVKGVDPTAPTPVLTPEQKLERGIVEVPTTAGTVKGVPVPTSYPTANYGMGYGERAAVNTTVPTPVDIPMRSGEMNQNPPIEGVPAVQNPFQTQYKQTPTVETGSTTVPSGTSTGGGGGGGGTGGGGGGGTTPTTPTVPKTETQMKSDLLFQQVQDAKFEYNAQLDSEFKLAASQLENEIAQMMVGRGGLYSSVTAAAYQSRLSAMQVEFTKAAYEKFVTERDFTLKMASFAADREDAAWTKNFQLAQFAAEREDAAFAKRMQEAQLRISQANAAYNRQRAQAADNQAKASQNLAMGLAEYSANDKAYQQMVQKWKSDGSAGYDVANFFGVPVGTAMGSSTSTYAIMGAAQKLNEAKTTLTNYSKQIGDADTYLGLLGGVAQAPDAKQTATQQNDAYNYLKTNAITMAGSGKTYTSILSQIQAEGGFNTYAPQIGSDNYASLISWLDGKVYQERNAASGAGVNPYLD